MAISIINTIDLSILPDLIFAFVEKIIADKSGSSGKEQLSKGFKYYIESYIHAVKCKNFIIYVYYNARAFG